MLTRSRANHCCLMGHPQKIPGVRNTLKEYLQHVARACLLVSVGILSFVACSGSECARENLIPYLLQVARPRHDELLFVKIDAQIYILDGMVASIYTSQRLGS
jgi:hypothetical protein